MASGVVELIMFLDVCRLYLETRRRASGPCTLWAIVTFVRTEETARDFLRWCEAYRVPHLRSRRDRRSSSLEDEPRIFGRRRPFHGLERKLLRLLQDLFYCNSCLPSADI